MKHLLIISHGFAPWGGPAAMRATKLAACGLKRGLRISVLTTAIDCAHVFDDPDLLDAMEGADILRVSNGTDYPLRGMLAKRLGYYPTRVMDKLIGKTRAKWVEDCFRTALARWDSDRPDVVYCTAPPHEVVLIARRLADAWDAPYTMDFRDPPWEIGMPNGELEAYVSSCDQAVLNTPLATDRIRNMYPRLSAKVETWTNGVDDVPESIAYAVNRDAGRKLKIVYPGGVYPSLVDAVRSVQPFVISNRCMVTIHGFSESKRYKQRRQLHEMGVDLQPPVASNGVNRIMQSSDSVLVILPPGYQYRIALKTYSAIRSGRPVIVFGENDATKDLLNNMPGVYYFDRDSSPECVEAMLKDVARYDPVAGWPQRHAWLQDRTWPNIFDGLFRRYL